MLRPHRRGRGGRPPEQHRVVAEEHRDAVEPRTHPHELAGRAQLVELLRPVVGHAPLQHLRLPQRHRQRQRLQRDERLAQRRAPVDPVPARQEAPERGLLGRLDLAAKRGERRAPQPAQHVGVAPLALDAARPQLATDERLVALEREQDVLDVDAERLVRLRGRERPTPARPPLHELAQRVGAALEEHVRQPGRRHDPERVAVPSSVLGGEERLPRADSHADRTPLAHERLRESRVELELVAAQPQQVVQLVGVARPRQQRRLHLRERVHVDELAQLLLAQQLLQQLAVERQRLRAALRGRRVVLVHVGRHSELDEHDRRAHHHERGASGVGADDLFHRPGLVAVAGLETSADGDDLFAAHLRSTGRVLGSFGGARHHGVGDGQGSARRGWCTR